MARELLTVCLPPMEVRAVPDAIARAMAPYDMNGDHVPYQGEWDAWSIGGSIPFAVRAGAEHDPRLIRVDDAPGPSARPQLPPSQCDGGPRALIDLETERAAVAGQARAEWRTWHAFARAYPPARTMDELRREFNAVHGLGPDSRFREQFEEQEVIKAIQHDPAVQALASGMFDPIRRFAEPEEVHVRRACSAVNPTHALLTLDGRWLDAASDILTGQGEIFGGSYNEFADAYLLGLPGECLVVRVRFHG
ncbi:hypothetical protein ACIRTB_13685 [Streptomyces sp. NPDC101158]|uniref:hypothetical protein n=1 Tax=Streptomyces sp. NPDC101158 TaxID=3366117 RepID=UPI003823EE05